MYTIDETVDDLLFERSARAACPDADPSDVIFFDIETTGLSPARSGLYLIGCLFIHGKSTVLKQLFADDYGDEELVLEAFSEILKNKSNMVHFNGSTFDIPYLKTKYEQHRLADPFSGKKSCDIYRKLMPLKRTLSLKSMKQKALEELAGLHREDIYSGGELINVYKAYQREVLMLRTTRHDETDEIREMRRILLLHNSDDIKGMMTVAELIGIIPFISGAFLAEDPYTEDGGIRVTVVPEKQVPSCLYEAGSSLRFMDVDKTGSFSVKVPLIKDSLKLFMNNFREHYYIPSKDMAVHSSVAGFIAPCDRKKATPATCYVPCDGEFLTIREEDLPDGLPLIKRSYGDRVAFVRKQDISPEVLKAAIMYRLNFID